MLFSFIVLRFYYILNLQCTVYSILWALFYIKCMTCHTSWKRGIILVCIYFPSFTTLILMLMWQTCLGILSLLLLSYLQFGSYITVINVKPIIYWNLLFLLFLKPQHIISFLFLYKNVLCVCEIPNLIKTRSLHL